MFYVPTLRPKHEWPQRLTCGRNVNPSLKTPGVVSFPGALGKSRLTTINRSMDAVALSQKMETPAAAAHRAKLGLCLSLDSVHVRCLHTGLRSGGERTHKGFFFFFGGGGREMNYGGMNENLQVNLQMDQLR